MIGLPVAPKKTVELLQKECDCVEVASAISNSFGAVAKDDEDFRQVTDEEVIEICKKRKKMQE